VLAENVTILKH